VISRIFAPVQIYGDFKIATYLDLLSFKALAQGDSFEFLKEPYLAKTRE